MPTKDIKEAMDNPCRSVDLIDHATAGGPLLGQILRHGICVLGNSPLHTQRIVHFHQRGFHAVVDMLAEQRRQGIG